MATDLRLEAAMGAVVQHWITHEILIPIIGRDSETHWHSTMPEWHDEFVVLEFLTSMLEEGVLSVNCETDVEWLRYLSETLKFWEQNSRAGKGEFGSTEPKGNVMLNITCNLLRETPPRLLRDLFNAAFDSGTLDADVDSSEHWTMLGEMMVPLLKQQLQIAW